MYGPCEGIMNILLEMLLAWQKKFFSKMVFFSKHQQNGFFFRGINKMAGGSRTVHQYGP